MSYEIYLKDATDTLLSNSTEYSEYKRISSDHYQYINYKLDGTEVSNLTNKQSGDKFVVLKGKLLAEESEEHYLQFFLDDKDTTTTGAPNEIEGSVLSLDIYMDADIYKETILTKIMDSSHGVRTSFDEAATTDEGIFEMEDDYGTSYYYRGAVENNYVKYGVNASGQEMWWRIIRINGDGSLRIIYDGTQGYANGTNGSARYIKTDQPFNALYDDAKYVGWMYGSANESEGTTTPSTSKTQTQSNVADSDIKKIVDTWFKENIVDTGYSTNINDEIFCNDRQIETDLGNSNGGAYSSYTILGYGKNSTLYKATSRNGNKVENPQPTFKCGEKNDAFTVSDTSKGNGALTYPVGLMTADEIMAAGSGKYGTKDSKYYLTRGTGVLWSLSPYYFNGNFVSIFNINTNAQLSSSNASIGGTSGSVAPVINISLEYAKTMIGTGTITDPYHA